MHAHLSSKLVLCSLRCADSSAAGGLPAVMAAKLNTVGAVTLKNLRKEGGAEAVDLAASVALKKTLGDTAVTLRLTEATLADMRSFNGAMLTLTKALGERGVLFVPNGAALHTEI